MLQKVKLRKPQHSVWLSFAYLKLKCIAEFCPRENNQPSVPQSTEVYVRKCPTCSKHLNPSNSPAFINQKSRHISKYCKEKHICFLHLHVNGYMHFSFIQNGQLLNQMTWPSRSQTPETSVRNIGRQKHQLP